MNRKRRKSAENHRTRCKALTNSKTATPLADKRRKPPFMQWWRGLDSNQRTLARADLQSAAFNHSATSPGAGRRATWRRRFCVSTRMGRVFAGLACQPKLRGAKAGAGEGNRTLVVSLEGFCSTIELHPPCLVTKKFFTRDLAVQCRWRGLDSNQRRRKANRFTVCPL